MKKKATFRELKFLSLLVMLLLLGSSFSLKAADVTISSAKTFAQALAAYDENPLTPQILDISGYLIIATGGSITNISGDIAINVGGTFLMKTGALISSIPPGQNTKAGDITIHVTGEITMNPGSTITGSAHQGQGGTIDITGGDDITIDGSVLSQSSGSGTGSNFGHGGFISIVAGKDLQAGKDLLISDEGVVSSKSGDPGADLVHLAACNITIYGLVESTGVGHALPSTPTHLVPPYRPDKPANSTAGVEVWAGDTLIIDNLTHSGEINADLSAGAGNHSWIDLFAKGVILIKGKPSGTEFAVHANNGGNGNTGGTITVKSINNNMTESGFAVQSNGGYSGNGGTITVEATLDVNLSDAKMEAKGATRNGGIINVRSFTGDIISNAGTAINVSRGSTSYALGVVTLKECGTAPFLGIVTPLPNPTPTMGVCGGVPYLPLEPPVGLSYVTFFECGCILCNGDTITVNQNVTVNFNVNPPTLTGPGAAILAPFFSYSRPAGTTADKWFARFDLGKNQLVLTNNATITVTKVGSGSNLYAPGLQVACDCHIKLDPGTHIIVESTNKNAGDIKMWIKGDIIVSGEIRNEVTGTNGLPGAIYAQSKCGEIKVQPSGRVFDLGIDGGGNLISLLTCGDNLAFSNVAGDILIDNGLVKAFAKAHANNDSITRPRIQVVSNLGAVTVNANTVEPLYDELSVNGGLYDIWGGLLSWITNNNRPGMVWVQADRDITVKGHGSDPTGPVRTSFGAIAAKATASNAPGGLVDVRTIHGKLHGYDRAFDVQGKNLLATNYAHIALLSLDSIVVIRQGDATCNPVIDASAPGSGTKGGLNEIIASNGKIKVAGTGPTPAIVSASGGIPGANKVFPAPVIKDNAVVIPPEQPIPPIAPTPLFDCDGNKLLSPLKPVTSGIIDNPVPANGMLIYPNPAKEAFTLKINNEINQGSILTLQDLAGKEILHNGLQLQAGVNSYPVSVAGISEGVYIVKLQTGTEVRQAKLIINR